MGKEICSLICAYSNHFYPSVTVVISVFIAVYEETAGLTVNDPVLRTHKVHMSSRIQI